MDVEYINRRRGSSSDSSDNEGFVSLPDPPPCFDTDPELNFGQSLDEGDIPVSPPARLVFDQNNVYSLYNEETLSLKEFIDNNQKSDSKGDVINKDLLPDENAFRTLLSSHIADSFIPDGDKYRLIKLYVLYLLSVHPDKNFVNACVDFLKVRRFKFSAFEILPIYINFGCSLETLVGSGNTIEIPIKFTRELYPERVIQYPYYNLEMVAEIIFYYVNRELVEINNELMVFLKAMVRMTCDRKIRCSRLLTQYSHLISAFAARLDKVYDTEEVISALHLADEHLLHQIDVVRVMHLPISSHVQALLYSRTLAYITETVIESDINPYTVEFVRFILRTLAEKFLPKLNVFCALQLLNSSLPVIPIEEKQFKIINSGIVRLENLFGVGGERHFMEDLRLKLELAKGDFLFRGEREQNTERKMVDFFKDLNFLILPLGMGSKRLNFFAEQVKKYSGKVVDKSAATHVIIDESVGENKEKCLMALKTSGIVVSAGVKFIGTKWLSKCFAMKTLIDTKNFEFDWIEMEIKRTNSRVDPDGNKKSERKESVENFDESSPEKKRKMDPEKCLCSQSSTTNRDISENKKLIMDELQKLANAFAARNDMWRAYSYRNAVGAVARYDKDITSFQEARAMPGIGEKMALKIMEILESGKCEKVRDIVDEKTKVLELFCNIWGVGPCTAENWYHLGFRTLEDLKEKAKLNKQQEIGLHCYEDFMQRMTREDVERIGSVVESELKEINGRYRMELVGSYRRGKPTCGDIDIMIVNPGPKYPHEVLLQLTHRLRKKGYMTHDLVELDDSTLGENNHRKYMGVFKFPGDKEIHRRIDIFVVPVNEYAPGLMHYTGSATFNRSIRLFASRKGFTLNEHGLYCGIIRKGSNILNEGELVPTPTESDIFNYLGLEYKLPEERDH